MAGYGLLPDIPTMDMPPTAYGGYASLSYGYEPPSSGYGYASKADMSFSTMDMLLPELHMVDTLLPTGGYACPNLNSSTMSWISNTRTGLFF